MAENLKHKPHHAAASLDVSPQDMRAWMDQAFDYLIPYIESIEKLPMRDATGLDALAKKLREPLPKTGSSLDSLLSTIFHDCVPKGVQVPNAGYMAYMPIGSLYHSALADFITMVINRWSGLYAFAPGFVEIENIVLAWLCEMMGLPKNSGGILTSGGSMANFSAVVTARQERLGEDFSRGVIYYSTQTHHSVAKAAHLAGFAKSQLRSITCDKQFRISLPELEATIADDKKRGLTPFLLVANAGSTAVGAIDDMKALAAIVRKQDMWFHVDAAWAGSLRLTQKGKKLFEHTSLADSITIDPHKALYLPFGCGALLVRDPKTLLAAHDFHAAYLPARDMEVALKSPAMLSPELSRRLRGLQVWLPIKMLGIEPFIAAWEEKLELASWAADEIRSIEHVEIVFEPQTVIAGFRLKLSGKTRDELNNINRAMLERINAHGKVLLSSVELDGDLVIRIVPFGQRTHKEHVALAVDYIREAASFCSTSHA